MKLELLPSDYYDKIVNVFLTFPLLGATVNFLSKNTTYGINNYHFSGKRSQFFMIFFRNALCFKVFLAFCFMHVFAIEHTSQENLVRTGAFRRKIVSIEQTTCW